MEMTLDQINKEIEEVYNKWHNLLGDRDNLLASTLIDKYYIIDNNVTKTYFHCNDFFVNDDCIKLQGELLRIYDEILESYCINETISYDRAYCFDQITEEQFNEIKSKYIK